VKPLRHVLCVDDEDDILELMKLCLELGGLEVTCCSSGPEALERIVGTPPDLVLLDVMMPGMDGPATFVKLRAIPGCEEIPVAFITARLREAETDEYRRLGACSVVAKPFDPMTLAGEIEQIWHSLRERQGQRMVAT
jgi:CheY-like chemotaxis protein